MDFRHISTQTQNVTQSVPQVSTAPVHQVTSALPAIPHAMDVV